MGVLAEVAGDLYEQLIELPETLVGEIIGNRLYTQPRPSGYHAVSGMGITDEISGPFQRGRGGPGGWLILNEPELHLVRDREVLVPDIAGWRRERLPHAPRGHRFEVPPDWVCEILSPHTLKKDRALKMPVYARYGVGYCWLVDPFQRTLEVFVLEQGRWRLEGVYADDARVAVPPFAAITIDLSGWWEDDGGSEPQS